MVSNTIIRAIEPMHAMIIDKIRFGSMIEPGQSLFILETEPAAYGGAGGERSREGSRRPADRRHSFGAFGALYMAGDEAQIDAPRRRPPRPSRRSGKESE